MNDLLKRGEDLDKLMENSKDLNKMSYDFYVTAKKTNKRCCSLYWHDLKYIHFKNNH